jgi:hypothetical protein
MVLILQAHKGFFYIQMPIAGDFIFDTEKPDSTTLEAFIFLHSSPGGCLK